MSSRLDRLVLLLDSGSTPLIRNEAAQQLADIQKKHPDELFNLLSRIVPYLKAKKWETRSAAAKALGGIAENAPIFDPNDTDDVSSLKAEAITEAENGFVPKKEEEEDPPPSNPDQLDLDTLDVPSILEYGTKLLGTEGKEYDMFLASLDPNRRLARQKDNLNARLGLSGEYFKDDYLKEMHEASNGINGSNSEFAGTPADAPHSSAAQFPSRDFVTTPVSAQQQTPATPGEAAEDGAMSKRQLNMLKRKNKKQLKNQANKVRVVDLASQKRPGSFDEPKPNPQAIKQEEAEPDETSPQTVADYFSLERKNEDDDSKLITEFKGSAAPGKSELQPELEEEQRDWPFERLCEFLMIDLFDHSWEVRHGATMGLREVLRVHGGAAGRERGKSRGTNDSLNQRWLNDLTCRICSLFMLDRFGDYISDTVVAPIRENAGQTLGSILRYMNVPLVHSVNKILNNLVLQDGIPEEKREWAPCHGGMIGLRYVVAVRGDVLLAEKNLVDGFLDVVIRGLTSRDDDIRAVSAATLIPVAQELVKLRPSSLSSLVTVIWDCLSDLSDDLSASTGSVMDLLAKLCGYSEVLDVMKANAAEDDAMSFARLVPRLFPFFRHVITGVRSAILRALMTFVELKGEGTSDWITGRTLRLVFQNIIVERNEEVLKLSLRVWVSLLESVQANQGIEYLVQELDPQISALLNLTLHPVGSPRNFLAMDPGWLIRPSGQVFSIPIVGAAQSPSGSGSEPPAKRRRKSNKADKFDQEENQSSASIHNIDTPVIQGDVDLVGQDVMIRSKIYASQALGRLICLWPTHFRAQKFGDVIIGALDSKYSSTPLTASMVIEEYAKHTQPGDEFVEVFAKPVANLVQSAPPQGYADTITFMRIMQAQCHALVNTFESGHIRRNALPTVAPKVQGEEDAGEHAFSIEKAEMILHQDFDRLKKMLSAEKRIVTARTLDEQRQEAERALEEAKTAKEQRDSRIKAAASGAIVALRKIPSKPSSTIKGLMESVKSEENVELQRRSAAGVVSLISQLVANGRSGVVQKLVENLSKFYCTDTAETPEFMPNSDIVDGILSLKKEGDIRDHADQEKFERESKAAQLMRRGAREAFANLAQVHGAGLLKKLPFLRTLIEQPLKKVFAGDIPQEIAQAGSTLGQEAVDGLSTLRVLVRNLHTDLHVFVIELVPLIVRALRCPLAVLRYMAAKTFATICNVINIQGFTTMIKDILPAISNSNDVSHRQGAVECVYHLVHVMEDQILPYVIFLIVPILGRMSDSNNDVRLIATTTFATLVKLVPLEAGIPDPPGFSEDMLQGRDRERKFMSQMLDPKKIEPFEIPVAIKATLRSYQQDGVNWLSFLNRYHLHGILCDDMGLGKTLQTLCMVASDHHMRAQEYEKTQNPDMRRLPSLIVCPPTLSGHWKQEIANYAPFLTAVAYVGPPDQRGRVKSLMTEADIVITSYEICRNDIEILAPLGWNYCVLDEGHLIKNPLAKISMAVKRLKSNHRLILSGTPIQNNVLELWSLFDFLMPGFLGSEKIFKDRFAKPIAASRFAKSSSKEQEAGALAIEALHKQALPFLMRRLKEEVLDDLPPKIVQNYYCDISDLQRKLFDDFNKKEGKALTELAARTEDQTGDKAREAKQHIFTALNYMRKLCNSPALVMKPSHRHYGDTVKYLSQRNLPPIDSALHAPKLSALKDLLVDCGIGASDASGSGSKESALVAGGGGGAVSQHRALIFCQMKEMLDIVASSVFKQLLPGATYLRLDGNVEATKRQEIVNTFNSDPSIDCLLLTTSVGGLGLNLTGADTVIFVEHDWNPQRDVQAMDRAHRIGQKKVVNVHRLITRGTLEERILGLQRFKLDVAGQVVQQQKGGAGLAGLDTGEILDLFSLGEGGEGELEQPRRQDGEGNVDAFGELKEKGKKGYLDDLGELWDDTQYEEEYDLEGFLKKMKV